MDEIICPICGRGNTLQAINCRYCQVPLDKPEKPLTNQLFESVDNPEFIKKRPSSKSKPGEDPSVDENTPEWLKRIRELKKADEEHEREKEKWRQQTLFGQDNHQKTKQKQPPPVKKPDVTTDPEKEKVLPENPMATGQTDKPLPSTPEVLNLRKGVQEVDDVEENQNLPEGYEPLPNK